MIAEYDRHFNDDTMQAIRKFGIASLIAEINDLGAKIKSPYALDLHLRKGSELMVYHGGTCLLTICLSGIINKSIRFKSESYYKKNRGCDAEFEKLIGAQENLDNMSELSSLTCEYLAKLINNPNAIHNKFFLNNKEGYWSSRLSINYGHNFEKGKRFVIIDREAVLDFGKVGAADKSSFYDEFKNNAQDIKRSLQERDNKKWGQITPHTNKKGEVISDFGDELDFLAIGPEKQLMCIELKHGSYTSGIYWGPLQASVYRDAYEAQLVNISDSIKKMVHQRVELGLLHKDALELLPNRNFTEVEGVLAITDFQPKIKSTCWKKTLEVNEKLEKPVTMIRSVDGEQWENSSTWK